MSRVRPLAEIKSKVSLEGETGQKPEARIAGGGKRSLGLRVSNESVEDFFSRETDGNYSRRKKQRAGGSAETGAVGGKVSEDKDDKRERDPEEEIEAKKPSLIYIAWKKSGLKSMCTVPKVDMLFSDEHYTAAMEAPAHQRGHVHLHWTADELKEQLRQSLQTDMSIEQTDKNAIAGTAAAFCDQLKEAIVTSDIETHRHQMAASLKRCHPITVYEKNKRKALEHITSIVNSLEIDLAEADKNLYEIGLSEFDKGLDLALQKARLIDEDQALDSKVRSVIGAHNKEMEMHLEPVLQAALRNHQKQMELFTVLCKAEEALSEKECKIAEQFKNTLHSTIKESSMDIASKYLLQS